MSADLYKDSLEQQVLDGSLTQSEMDDLLEQKTHFDANRQFIENNHDHKVVGYCNGEIFIADSMKELLAKAEAAHSGKMTYFETVGYSLFD